MIDRIVWIDLETTGLDERAPDAAILEYACIVTDNQFKELGRWQRVTHAARDVHFGGLHAAVQQMHLANGLWVESLQAPFADHVRDLCQFLCEHDVVVGVEHGDGYHSAPVNSKGEAPLAGFGVHFDRKWLPAAVTRLLHYRNFDVTALNYMCEWYFPVLFSARPRLGDKKHRAMPDIENALDCARHYASRLGLQPVYDGEFRGAVVSSIGSEVTIDFDELRHRHHLTADEARALAGKLCMHAILAQ